MAAVLDAVHQLFVEGHHEPAAEEVAARSGVSLRSIYRYFPDREQLLVAALRLLDTAGGGELALPAALPVVRAGIGITGDDQDICF